MWITHLLPLACTMTKQLQVTVSWQSLDMALVNRRGPLVYQGTPSRRPAEEREMGGIAQIPVCLLVVALVLLMSIYGKRCITVHVEEKRGGAATHHVRPRQPPPPRAVWPEFSDHDRRPSAWAFSDRQAIKEGLKHTTIDARQPFS